MKKIWSTPEGHMKLLHLYIALAVTLSCLAGYSAYSQGNGWGEVLVALLTSLALMGMLPFVVWFLGFFLLIVAAWMADVLLAPIAVWIHGNR